MKMNTVCWSKPKDKLIVGDEVDHEWKQVVLLVCLSLCKHNWLKAHSCMQELMQLTGNWALFCVMYDAALGKSL